ncbi:MAG: repressor LexA, partial [Firmicutes bacterium]|nr:repressor LexA [Bacillota bacterium]
VVDTEDHAATAAAEAGHNIVAEREDIADIPIVGRVAAGTPILAEQNIEDTFPVPARYAAGGTSYMLRVRGESMIEAGIMDGDLILVQQQDTARNGEIVVAMIDGFESEATVKTFYHEGDHIRLQPENQTMSPIIVKDVKILGKVKGVFRYFS